jgi:DNA-binding NtrC family response regulator
MQEVFKAIGQVAAQDVTVLITGESGTGKELAARAVYQHSRRRDAPFLAVNCAAIPGQLFESELFGHERGAFTGADRVHVGRFERCDGGTLFFDEIGELAASTQAKVLRVLQGGEFERLGGSQVHTVDVRVIAATNKDLAEEVTRGRFREDLYWRLKVFTIEMPPLRERVEDLPELVDYFLGRYGRDFGKPVRFVASSLLERLKSHSWPGNVRELENRLKRAVLMTRGDILLEEHIPLDGPSAGGAGSADRLQDAGSLRRRLRGIVGQLVETGHECSRDAVVSLVEDALIASALEKCDGNQVKAARLLGISRNTLRDRLKRPSRNGDVG